MKINMIIKENLQIRSFQLFFIVLGIQIGVGVLSAPRDIFSIAHQDAWLSVIIAYLYMLIVIWAMFSILNQYENTDIFGIQVDVFGKWIGKFLGSIYILFFMLELLSVLLAYTEIIQIFLFPTLPAFMMGLMLFILVVYSVLGGIRVVVGVVFLFVLLSPWVFILLYDPITRIEPAHYLPLFDASLIELLKGARTTAYTFLGIEILFIIYPFIKDKKTTKLPFYLGSTVSALIILLTTIISIGYYSPNDFELMDWPVLSLFKSVSFSFLERFDYLVIVEWMMVVIPTMILLMWAITHGTKRLYAIPQKITLFSVAIILLGISTFTKTNFHIKNIGNVVNQIGLIIVFIYPLILLPIVLIKKRMQSRKEMHRE